MEIDELENKLFSFKMEFEANTKALWTGQFFHPEKNVFKLTKNPRGKIKSRHCQENVV